MIPVTMTTRGERELALRFESFPVQLHDKLLARITGLTAELESRIEAATPVGKTGKLRSEETQRIFGDVATRVAGYVGIYAPGGGSGAYAKAATIEYGTNKPRRAFEKRGSMVDGLYSPRRRIINKLSKPVHIEAFRYLRGPLEAMRSEIEAALAEVVSSTVDEANT